MPTLLTGRVSRVGHFSVVSSYDFNDLKNCSPDTEMRQILVKNQGPSRSVKAGLSTDHFTSARQIKEKPVAPIKTLVAIGQICVGAASKSLFVVVNETDYSPSVSCLFGLSVWDSVEDRPVGLDQSSSLLIASTETTNLLAAVVKTIRSEQRLSLAQPDSPNLISANWISCSGDNFEPNKTPNSHRLTCGQQGSYYCRAGLAPPHRSRLGRPS